MRTRFSVEAFGAILGGGLALSFSLAQAPALPQEYPFPNRFLSTSKDLTFCLDKQNPLWRLQQRIAEEIAKALGKPAKFYVHREAEREAMPQPVERREFQVLLASRCDVYMGLLGSTTPAFDYPADEQMLATRPYYKTRYLLVTRDPQITSLSKIPRGGQLGMVSGSVPYLLLYRQLSGKVSIYPTVSAQDLLAHLKSGKLQAGILFAPVFFGAEDPAKSGFSAFPLNGIPNLEWYVIAAVARDRPTLRSQLDGAIGKLLSSGQMAKLLKEFGLPEQFFSPTSPTERRPQSESDR